MSMCFAFTFYYLWPFCVLLGQSPDRCPIFLLLVIETDKFLKPNTHAHFWATEEKIKSAMGKRRQRYLEQWKLYLRFCCLDILETFDFSEKWIVNCSNESQQHGFASIAYDWVGNGKILRCRTWQSWLNPKSIFHQGGEGGWARNGGQEFAWKNSRSESRKLSSIAYC